MNHQTVTELRLHLSVLMQSYTQASSAAHEAACSEDFCTLRLSRFVRKLMEQLCI